MKFDAVAFPAYSAEDPVEPLSRDELETLDNEALFRIRAAWQKTVDTYRARDWFCEIVEARKARVALIDSILAARA